MTFSVGRILGNIRGNYSTPLNKLDATQSQNFIQAAVSSNQSINLERPESRNSTPYGDSTKGKNVYYLA